MPKHMVAVATDANYSKYLEVMLYQLSVNSSWRDVCILVDGSAELGNALNSRAIEFGLNPKVILVNEILDTYPKMLSRGHVSRATFARLLLVRLLPKDVKKILYLDLDILICRNISELMEIDLERPIAAVGHGSKFGYEDATYFNAGVLLIDCERWREEDSVEKFLTILQSDAKLKFQDQDLLNIVFKDNWQPLPSVANVDARSFGKIDFKDPMIVHFIGPQKPWLFNINQYSDAWRETASIAGVELDFNLRVSAKYRFLVLGRKIRKSLLKLLSKFLPRSLKNAIKKFLRQIG